MDDIKHDFDQLMHFLLIQSRVLEDDIYYIVFKDSVIIEAIQKKHASMIKGKIEERLKKEVNVKFIPIIEYEQKYKEIYGYTLEPSEEIEQIEKVIEFFQDQRVSFEVK